MPKKLLFNRLKLRSFRKKIGLTQMQMAEKIGVAHITYQAWENGKREPLQSLPRLTLVMEEYGEDINSLYDIAEVESVEKVERDFDAELLKSLRKERGLSQEELANAIKVHPQTISKWERGIQLCAPVYICALAEVFGIPKESFFLKKGER